MIQSTRSREPPRSVFMSNLVMMLCRECLRVSLRERASTASKKTLRTYSKRPDSESVP